MRKVYFEVLPKKNSGKVDWEKCIGYKVDFVYDDVIGEVEIIDIEKPKGVKFLYNNKVYVKNYSLFLNCNFGGVVKKYTKEFKLELEDCLLDENRNLIITDRKRGEGKDKSRKYYKYKCSVCGFDCSGDIYKGGKRCDDYWIEESSLINGVGCPLCYGIIVVSGINDIATTHPHKIKFFQNEEDAKKVSLNSNVRVDAKCPDCGTIKNNYLLKTISNYNSVSCTCGDGFSMPEKIMYSVLKQSSIDFTTQLSKATFRWCEDRRYDFYIPSLNMIIETHGGQHPNTKYSGASFRTLSGKSTEEEKENDIYKRNLALSNGIEKYIEIDCSLSDVIFIKENIIKSELSNYIDLSLVDWGKVGEFSLNNLAKEVCDYWNNREPWETTGALCKKFGLSDTTIRRYLEQWTSLGYCDYDPKKRYKKPIAPRQLLSEEERQIMIKERNKKISEAQKGKRCGEKNPMYGKKRDAEVVNKIKNSNTKSVVCLNTGVAYHTHDDIPNNFSPKQITNCCRGGTRSSGKMEDGTKAVWVWYEDYLTMTKEEIDEKIRIGNSKEWLIEKMNKKKGKNSHTARKVICITTNEIFDTIEEGAKFYNANYTSVISCCSKRTKSAGKLPDGTKLVWMYLSDYNEQQNNSNPQEVAS